MNKYVIILLLINCHISAQEYNPYSFIDFKTEWTHFSYSDELLSHDIQSYGLVDKIVTDNSVYMAYQISDKFWYFNGFLIEKLDIATGELEWNYKYFPESFYNREYPSSLSLGNDGTLILSSFRQITEKPQGSRWYDAHMSTWIFDQQSGELLDTIITDVTDTTIVDMVMPFNFFLPRSVETRIERNNNGIQYLKSQFYVEGDVGAIGISTYDMTIDGHTTWDTFVHFQMEYPRIIQNRTIRKPDGGFFHYRRSEAYQNGKDSFHIEITNLDSKLHVEDSKSLTEYFTRGYQWLCYIDKSVFCVMHYGNKIFDDLPYRHQKLFTFDYEGNLLQEIPLTRDDGTNLYSESGFNVMYIEELDKTLLLSHFRDETGNYWEWYFNLDKESFQQIGKMEIENHSDEFLWDFFPEYTYMEWLGDGKIFVHALHLNTGSNTTGSKIPSISIFSLDEIKVTVSISQVKGSSPFIIYPNPSSNEILFEGETGKYVKYEFLDLGGKLLKTDKFHQEPIDVGNILPGTYLLKMYDQNGKTEIKKVVILR